METTESDHSNWRLPENDIGSSSLSRNCLHPQSMAANLVVDDLDTFLSRGPPLSSPPDFLGKRSGCEQRLLQREEEDCRQFRHEQTGSFFDYHILRWQRFAPCLQCLARSSAIARSSIRLEDDDEEDVDNFRL